MNALRMVIPPRYPPVSDPRAITVAGILRMSIGDALTNIIPVFIQSEATAGRGVYLAAQILPANNV